MEEKVYIPSEGFKLAGVLHWPDNIHSSQRRPGFVVMHGFGSTMNAVGPLTTGRLLARLGYVALRLDFRGCGESEGPKGRVICQEQVKDAQNAISYLMERPEVDGERVGLFGHSVGAAVALYTAGIDLRAAVCITCGGWGDGERKFRLQHPSPEAWQKLIDTIADGKWRRANGDEIMVSRWDIVPIPIGMRTGLPPGAATEFPSEVMEMMYKFRPLDVVAKIAPRPLLLMHSSRDSVTPTELSIDIFRQAGQPADLHLFSNMDHFGFNDSNTMALDVVRDWLSLRFPVNLPAD